MPSQFPQVKKECEFLDEIFYNMLLGKKAERKDLNKNKFLEYLTKYYNKEIERSKLCGSDEGIVKKQKKSCFPAC